MYGWAEGACTTKAVDNISPDCHGMRREHCGVRRHAMKDREMKEAYSDQRVSKDACDRSNPDPPLNDGRSIVHDIQLPPKACAAEESGAATTALADLNSASATTFSPRRGSRLVEASTTA